MSSPPAAADFSATISASTLARRLPHALPRSRRRAWPANGGRSCSRSGTRTSTRSTRRPPTPSHEGTPLARSTNRRDRRVVGRLKVKNYKTLADLIHAVYSIDASALKDPDAPGTEGFVVQDAAVTVPPAFSPQAPMQTDGPEQSGASPVASGSGERGSAPVGAGIGLDILPRKPCSGSRDRPAGSRSCGSRSRRSDASTSRPREAQGRYRHLTARRRRLTISRCS